MQREGRKTPPTGGGTHSRNGLLPGCASAIYPTVGVHAVDANVQARSRRFTDGALDGGTHNPQTPLVSRWIGAEYVCKDVVRLPHHRKGGTLIRPVLNLAEGSSTNYKASNVSLCMCVSACLSVYERLENQTTKLHRGRNHRGGGGGGACRDFWTHGTRPV